LNQPNTFRVIETYDSIPSSSAKQLYNPESVTDRLDNTKAPRVTPSPGKVEIPVSSLSES